MDTLVEGEVTAHLSGGTVLQEVGADMDREEASAVVRRHQAGMVAVEAARQV